MAGCIRKVFLQLLAGALVLVSCSMAMAQNPFVTTWQTDNPGISGSTSVKLPVISGRTGYNFDVDWESDGVYDDLGVTGPISHDYGTAGTYTISIRGDFPAMQFANRDENIGPNHDDALKLMEVNQWGDIVWYSMAYALYGCENMQLLATDAPDLTNVSSMNSMFRRCKLMNTDINHWEVGNVRDFFSVFNSCSIYNQPLDKWDMSSATSISYMFFFCKAFNQPLNAWNVSNVTNFTEAFVGCESFDQPLDKWNVSSATYLTRMFRLAKIFNQDISGWNVSNVQSFAGMFTQANAFNQNLNNWNVSGATNFSNMFEATFSFDQPLDKWDMGNATNTSYMFSQSAFNQDISGWNVRRVQNMSAMFYNNRSFDQPIGNWNVSNVQNMAMMFRGAEAFNQPLEEWYTGNVQNMGGMFLGAKTFNRDISGWNTGRVEDLSGMFNLSIVFNQDIGNWNTSSATDMSGMFSQNGVFNQDLKNWDVSGVTDMSGMFYRATAFDHALGDWDIRSVTDMENMLDYSGLSVTSYDNTLIGWAAADKNSGITLGVQGLQYCNADSERKKLEDEHGWTFNGDSGDCSSVVFVTTWKTDNPGVSGSTSIKLPVVSEKGGYNFDVDWESDGIWDDTGVNGPISHDYGVAGTYTVSIRGDFPYMYFAKNSTKIGPEYNDAQKLIEINQWGEIEWEDMYYALAGCENMTLKATDAPNLKSVQNMTAMFYDCKSFNTDINHWDVSSVTNFSLFLYNCEKFNKPLDQWNMSNASRLSFMFYGCNSFNQNLNNWVVDKVTDFNWIFHNCIVFNQPLDKWNMNNAISIGYMFSGCKSFNQDITEWDVSAVRDFSGTFASAGSFSQNLNNWQVGSGTNFYMMFSGASSFNLPLDTWDMSNAINTSSMFSNTSFNQDISGWEVNKVRNMTSMFSHNEAFNQPLNSWNVSNVEEIVAMFMGASSFNQDLSSWRLDKVTRFSGLFYKASSFNQDLSSWNTGNITDMQYIFSEATSYNHSLEDWDISSVTNMNHMLDNSGLSAYHYDRTLMGWAASGTKNSNLTVGVENLEFCTGEAARTTLINDYNWTFEGDVKNCGYTPTGFITTWKTDNPGSSGNTSVTIPTAAGSIYNYDVDWDNDGVYDEFGITGDITHDFGTAGTYTIRINGDFPRIFFDYYKANDAAKLIDVVQWGDISWSSMKDAFDGCVNLNFSATDAPDLSRVTSLSGMLYGCTTFNSNMNHWDVSTITDFSDIFHTARAYNQPMNNWNVSNGTNFREMFIEASSFNQDISSWKVQNATDMYRTFAWAAAFNQDISKWDMSKVKTTYEMFRAAVSFNQDIGGWNVSEVQNMYHMFWGASSFNQNINAWNVGKVTNMEGMFGYATAFNQDLNDWDVRNVITMRQLFLEATSFNGDITGWNVSNLQNMGYVFAGATSFNRDIGNWNPESASTMLLMFGGATVFNQDIGRWNVSNVWNTAGMFSDAISFDQDIGNWNTASLRRTNSMFKNARLFNQDIGRWNMSQVTEMRGMFWGASSFNQDIGSWNVSNAEDMAYVFFVARKFNQNIGSWNTGSATTMQNMFNGASVFNQDLGDWDVSHVEDMNSMFSGTAIDQNFGRWDVGKVTSMARMFSGVTLSTANYDSLLIGWNEQDLQHGVKFSGGSSQYCAGATARAEMIANDGWEIEDGGPEGTAPVAVCRDITLYMQQDGTVSFTVSDLDGGSSDNCSDIMLSSTRTAFDCSEVNTTFTETLTVSDLPGNSSTCNASVTLLPSLDFSCPEDITITVPEGSCTAPATWAAPSVACGATLTSSFTSGQVFEAGTTVVTYTAEDGMGNTNTCSFNVTVIPTPAFTNCPADISVPVNAPDCQATVSWEEPAASCGYSVTSTHAPGDTFAQGSTEVVYTATGPGGATATCRFTVTVASDLGIAGADLQTPSCAGMPDGLISVQVMGGNAPYTYAWYNVENKLAGTASTLAPAAAGTYTVEVTDATGCSALQSYQLDEPEPLNLSYTLEKSDDGYGAVAMAATEGGTPPYTYRWDGDELEAGLSQNHMMIPGPGTYYLQVSDAMGCSMEMEVPVTVDDMRCESLEYILYPNPTEGLLHLSFGTCISEVSIAVYDILGKKLMEVESAGIDNTISLHHLTDGTYNVRISDGTTTRYERIFLKK